MRLTGRSILLLLLFFMTSIVHAADLRLEKVAEQIYAIVGDTAQRSPENLANNATFGVVITPEGVVLLDPGGSEKGAEAIDRMIRTLTEKPVVTVINTGGQDHRWLGNHYWKTRGAKIIASSAAVEDHKARAEQQLDILYRLVGEAGMMGTVPVYADTTFDSEYSLEVGGVQFELRHEGQAHTPGDSFIWLPQSRVLFTGDIVYHDRLLGVGAQSNSSSWLEVFAKISEFPLATVVPGHGVPGTAAKSQRETGDYLQALRSRVGKFLESGGALEDISKVDQSDFSYLKVFGELSGRNAHQVYQEMEFDF